MDGPCLRTLPTNLPGADLNSSAGPKGGGQDARNKVMQGAAFRRLGVPEASDRIVGPRRSAGSVRGIQSSFDKDAPLY